MSRYNVCAMIPYGLDVEADSPEEAVEVFFGLGGAELANYGCDGIHITNLDTGEETDE